MSSLPSSILSTIESLFMGRTNFVVPRYQREYSWSKSNVETLITDLKKVFNNNAGLNACITVLLKRHPHGHDFNIDWTLEHIFPQNPRPEDWSHFEISDTDDSVNRLCYSFGNFILLKKGLNSKASNSSFQKKKLLYVERHVEDQFSRIEPRLSVQSCDEWTPEIINERNAKMSEELYHELIGIHL